MALISDFDFSGCRYNPRDQKFTLNLKEDIPAFNETKVQGIKPIFTYIVILYDKESPLHRKYPEYYERKINAAEIAKLPRSDCGFSAETKEILEGRNDDVNKLVVSYLANTGDIEYMMIIN